ncbi:MAG TPA: membrane dipeptidase, partial [Spirochaetaceae bacterium]|nr:membrane dipeptidase [Spirochaetaceae bacterium]
KDAADWPTLEALLRRRGFCEGDLDKLFLGNWRRVLKTVQG